MGVKVSPVSYTLREINNNKCICILVRWSNVHVVSFKISCVLRKQIWDYYYNDGATKEWLSNVFFKIKSATCTYVFDYNLLDLIATKSSFFHISLFNPFHCAYSTDYCFIWQCYITKTSKCLGLGGNRMISVLFSSKSIQLPIRR